MISVLILTRNEQQALPGCLESVSWSDDVHVYDSFSSDDTVAIAEKAGAHVTQRQFDNWASHQNYALRTISFKHPWVFYIDADERMTRELKQSALDAVESGKDHVAYQAQRRDFLGGTWLKHVQTTSLYLRLFRPDKMRYERLVNPVSIPDGTVGRLSGYLDHYPFSKGMSYWLERHNSYSSLEARQIAIDQDRDERLSLRRIFFASNLSERRFHQKELFYRLPARPILKFFLLYVAKRGFLDGKAGLTYATLQSFYEWMIVLKTRELAQQAPPSSKIKSGDSGRRVTIAGKVSR
jgi:glycosyltransferase involved in cell wall biosynthesis